MNCALNWMAGVLVLVMMTVLLFSSPRPSVAGPKQTQQEATGASLLTGALIYNYARHQNSRNGAYALAAGAGTAYLWNKYSHQRQTEKRQEAARMNYFRRRASYYHHLTRSGHRKLSRTHRISPYRRYH